MTIQVIRTSLDWFQCSFSGELDSGVAEKLAALKTRAQNRNTPEPYTLGLIEFFVQDKGRGMFSYVLKHPEIEVWLAPNATKGSPNASIRLSAFGLANTEATLLWEIACVCLGTLGHFSPLALTRVDVAADFQGWEPTYGDMRGMVCDAPYRGLHGTAESIGTYQYGKGAVVLRLYNKSVEIAEHKRLWMKEVWSLTRRYDASLPVWRIEVQLRNQALKELGVFTPAQALDDPAALLGYGLTWAQLRVPTNDTTKARWPEDPRWTALRKGVFDGVPMNRCACVSELMSLDRTNAQFLGAVATAAAYFETNDFMDAVWRLSYAVKVHMMTNKVDFPELVETKHRRIVGRL